MSNDVTQRLQLTENFITPVKKVNNNSPDENGNININEYSFTVENGRLCINKIGGEN